MNIIVTGGAGFIGSNFIYYLLDEYPEDKVVCIDALTYAGNLYTLDNAFTSSKFSFFNSNITDKKAIEDIFETTRPDIVVNFAAESHVDRSITDPEVFLRTNILGTQVLLDLSLKYNVSRFHQISTDEVYGDLPLNRPDLFFTEMTPINTSSPYSASKAAADLLSQAYFKTYNLPVTISRCSNNYGPYHFPEKLIPLIIINCIMNRPLPVYGEGKNVRDWLYVRDHCSAIDKIIRCGTVGEIYNIGGHNERTNIDVIKKIIHLLGKDESLITHVEDRKGHDLRYAIDASKIEKELGWKTSVLFEEGLDETVKWYVANYFWWESILNGDYIKYNKMMCRENGNRNRNRESV